MVARFALFFKKKKEKKYVQMLEKFSTILSFSFFSPLPLALYPLSHPPIFSLPKHHGKCELDLDYFLSRLSTDYLSLSLSLSIYIQAQPAAPGATGQQDALDKGISQVLNKTGHGQSNSTVEKISDGFRKIFKKLSGKGESMRQDYHSCLKLT